MYRRKIEDTDSPKTVRLSEACARYGLGENSMKKVAKDAGAIVRIGKCYLINLSIVDRYMDNMSG